LGPLYTSRTAKARNLKFGVQIDYDECYSKKYKIRGQKERGLGYVTYFSILGSLNISRMAKAANFQKLSMGMTGISIVVQGPSPQWDGTERGARGLCPL